MSHRVRATDDLTLCIRQADAERFEALPCFHINALQPVARRRTRRHDVDLVTYTLSSGPLGELEKAFLAGLQEACIPFDLFIDGSGLYNSPVLYFRFNDDGDTILTPRANRPDWDSQTRNIAIHRTKHLLLAGSH